MKRPVLPNFNSTSLSYTVAFHANRADYACALDIINKLTAKTMKDKIFRNRLKMKRFKIGINTNMLDTDTIRNLHVYLYVFF